MDFQEENGCGMDGYNGYVTMLLEFGGTCVID